MNTSTRALVKGSSRSALIWRPLVALLVVLMAGGCRERAPTQAAPHEVRAIQERARHDMALIVEAIGEYALLNAGRWPESLAVLAEPDGDEGTYIDLVPSDPWGRAYLYEMHSHDEPWVLMTLGGDGLPGGVGEHEDISAPWFGFHNASLKVVDLDRTETHVFRLTHEGPTEAWNGVRGGGALHFAGYAPVSPIYLLEVEGPDGWRIVEPTWDGLGLTDQSLAPGHSIEFSVDSAGHEPFRIGVRVVDDSGGSVVWSERVEPGP